MGKHSTAESREERAERIRAQRTKGESRAQSRHQMGISQGQRIDIRVPSAELKAASEEQSKNAKNRED
jgi:hypothetical protein